MNFKFKNFNAFWTLKNKQALSDLRKLDNPSVLSLHYFIFSMKYYFYNKLPLYLFMEVLSINVTIVQRKEFLENKSELRLKRPEIV